MKLSLFYWLRDGGRIPRKIKKRVIGNKLGGRSLKKMIEETVVGPPIKTMYERVEFSPHGAFCPHCGERQYYGHGNRTQYPEHWETFYCLRCRSAVGYIDNSPFIHALECKDNHYDPTF